MIFELDPAAWERQARTVDALADGLAPPPGLALPDDRYARALGDVPAASDRAARELHREAVAELRGLAERIRSRARSVTGVDEAGAAAIGTVAIGGVL